MEATSGDYPDRGSQIIGVCAFMLILTTISLILRFWSRYISTKAGFWWDDWTVLASYPLVVALNGVTLYWESIGLGRPIKDQPTPLSKHLLIFFAINFIYNTGLTLIKLSVVLFYWRIFNTTKVHRRLLLATGFLVVSWCIAFNLFVIWACDPISKSWDPMEAGKCVPELRAMYGATITNILIDVIILLVPMPIIWKLHMGRPRKVALTGVFITGYCVAAISIARVVTIVRLGDDLEKDFSYNFTDAEMMVCIETGIATWSCSLPAIYQLCKKLFFGGDDASRALSGQGSLVAMGSLANPVNKNRGFDKMISSVNDDPDSQSELSSRSGAVQSEEHQHLHQAAAKIWSSSVSSSASGGPQNQAESHGMDGSSIYVQHAFDVENSQRE